MQEIANDAAAGRIPYCRDHDLVAPLEKFGQSIVRGLDINCYSGDETAARLEIRTTSRLTESKVWRITFDFQTSDDVQLVSEKIQKAFGLPVDAARMSKTDPFLQYGDGPVMLLATRIGVFILSKSRMIHSDD